MGELNKQKRGLRHFLVGCLLLASSQVWAVERSLVVIPLKHALPEQVISTVEAVLPDEATVTSFQNQLILQVTSSEQKTVEQLLEQIDKAPQQLLITVRTPRFLGSTEQSVSASGVFADGKVQVGDRENSGRIVIRSDSASGTSQGRQSVRATEGMPAYIAVGSSKPVTSYRVDGLGHREQITEYKAADQGFYVIARLTGDTVILDIRQTDDQHGADAIHTSRISTSVTGEVGEWISIGRLGTEVSTENRGLVIRSSDARTGAGTIELLVEKF